ncbi:MAG TPA: TPM domain-containing protein [Steroidobacteraceae bacterium]|nr:TPM domain-containing protein [Steroidobacteraceae bacterium]
MRSGRLPYTAVGASLVLALLAVVPLVRADVAVPPVARVTDLTGTLTAAQQAALDKTLADFESRKGSQIAVLIVPTTAPEDIAQFGIRVADAWKLGRKGIDDGAILIVAVEDRRMRIEVGQGLEGAVTDLAANRILEEYLRPHFRAGDFYGGVNAAVVRLIGLVDGGPLPAAKAREWQRAPRGVEHLIPILLVLGLIAGPILRRVFGRPLGAAATGGVAGLLAFLLIGVMGIAVLAGIAAFVFALLGGLGGGTWGTPGRGGFGGGLGGFGGGGFGGGFSGGGGGFSGGGASGGW